MEIVKAISASALLKKGGALSMASAEDLVQYLSPEYPARVQRRAAHNYHRRIVEGFSAGCAWLAGGDLAARPKWDAADRERVRLLAATDGIDAVAARLGVSPARVRKAVKG